MTGISLGVMRPDPKAILLEAYCPHCRRGVRGTALGVAGDEVKAQALCGECGKEFTIAATAKELDS